MYFAERAERQKVDLYDAAVGAMQTAIAASFDKKAAEALALARRMRKAERARKAQEANREATDETQDEPDVNELWPDEEG